MLDLAYLRENLELARTRLAHRGYAFDVETFKRLDSERKSLIQEVESHRQQLKAGSAEIGKRRRENTDTSDMQNQMTAISEKIKALELLLKTVEDKLSEMAAVMPNLPDPSVPLGFTEAENVEVGALFWRGSEV